MARTRNIVTLMLVVVVAMIAGVSGWLIRDSAAPRGAALEVPPSESRDSGTEMPAIMISPEEERAPLVPRIEPPEVEKLATSGEDESEEGEPSAYVPPTREEYNLQTMVEVSALFCSEEGGLRDIGIDSPYLQAQQLLVISMATALDDMGRWEDPATSHLPYSLPDADPDDRVFGLSGRRYRFKSYEFPLYDQFIELITNPETGSWYSLETGHIRRRELPAQFSTELCARVEEAIQILQRK